MIRTKKALTLAATLIMALPQLYPQQNDTAPELSGKVAILPGEEGTIITGTEDTTAKDGTTAGITKPETTPSIPIPKDKTDTRDQTNTGTKTEDKDDQNQTETEIITDIMADIWFKSNMCVIFDKFPYFDGPYLTFDNSLANTPVNIVERGDKFYRFTADTSIFYSPRFGGGNITRFEGYLFKFIGPFMELQSYVPLKSQVLKNELSYQGNLRLGLEVAIFQGNWLSGIFTTQWSHCFNMDIPDGFLFGIILRSYPVKPLLLEYRFNVGTYDTKKDYAMIESHLEAGAMLFNSAFEIYGAWNWQLKTLLDYSGHGFELGAKFHF